MKPKDVQTYRLFYVMGEADSVKAKFELRDAGVPIVLEPVTKDRERTILGVDFGVTRFPVLFSDRAYWQGLSAIRSFIRRWKRRR